MTTYLLGYHYLHIMAVTGLLSINTPKFESMRVSEIHWIFAILTDSYLDWSAVLMDIALLIWLMSDFFVPFCVFVSIFYFDVTVSYWVAYVFYYEFLLAQYSPSIFHFHFLSFNLETFPKSYISARSDIDKPPQDKFWRKYFLPPVFQLRSPSRVRLKTLNLTWPVT